VAAPALPPTLSLEASLNLVFIRSTTFLSDSLLLHPRIALKKFLKKNAGEETIAVLDAKLGNLVKEKMDIPCVHSNAILELARGVRSQLQGLIRWGLSAGAFTNAHCMPPTTLRTRDISVGLFSNLNDPPLPPFCHTATTSATQVQLISCFIPSPPF
jgi:hypothetical protein